MTQLTLLRTRHPTRIDLKKSQEIKKTSAKTIGFGCRVGKCNLLTSVTGDICKDKVKTGDTGECEAYQSMATIQTFFSPSGLQRAFNSDEWRADRLHRTKMGHTGLTRK